MSEKKQDFKPPIAKIIPKKFTVHDLDIEDNYFWLREKSNPEVIEYLEAENSYTEAKMKHTEELQEKLYHEMVSRIKETDLEVPEKKGDYYYYSRTVKGEQYKIYCRKKGNLDAEEEVLLDVNELAKGYKYFWIGIFKISPNHQFLAYSVDTTGSEEYILYIKNLKTGDLLEDKIYKTGYYVEWANDNQTLFYVILDEAKRPFKLFRHKMDSASEKDILIYHEKDEAYRLEFSKSKDEKYVFINLKSNITSEVWFLEADTPEEQFKLVQARQKNVEYSTAHHGGKFYIVTNDKATNFRLMVTSVENPSKVNWKEVMPHSKSIKIDRVEAFKDHLAVYERKNGLKTIRIKNLTTNVEHYIDFPEEVYTYNYQTAPKNPEFNTNILRFFYTSFVTPKSVYDYNMDTKKLELKKQEEVLGNYDPSLYKSERVFAKAQDGVNIPISLVYKKGLIKNGENPLLLNGYGSYGYSTEPGFISNRFSLLDRGFVYAIAHIRGGGELGREWYDNGKLLKKKNTFTDFINCAEYLIEQKFTSPKHLAIIGGSAGGLLIGAVLNMRPELFKVAVARVPFVDVINTMLDPSIPLTVIEYDEWGNPNEKTYFDYMMSYSPYDNVEAKNYSAILITAGLNDPRVQYWEPAKWIAKLRSLKTDNNRLLLKMDMSVGHGASSGRYDYLKDIAFNYAFVLDELGIKE
ncbi:MAG: S9 family peptidase [Candidatus Hodarchaeota archaeon]